MGDGPDNGGLSRFAGRVLVFLLLTATALLIWQLRGVLLLLFAAVLVAVVLRAGTRAMLRRLPVGPRLALALVTVLIFSACAAATWMFGQEVLHQLDVLIQQLPEAWAAVERRADAAGLLETLRERIRASIPSGGGLLTVVRTILGGLSGALSGALLALLGGIYLAAQPALYRRGVLRLMPMRHRALVARSLDDAGIALHAWLLGQLFVMAVVGLAIALGAWLIGLPSPLALGLIAALMGFIPAIGPLFGALPGILVALTLDTRALVMTVLLYLVVQQLAGAVLEPLVVQRLVKLPPALMLFGLVTVGALFGLVGVLLTGPVIVVTYVLVRRLYVEAVLGDRLDSPS